MELNYFKDHLFDLINESPLLSIHDMVATDKEDKLLVILNDGTQFEIVCKEK